MYKDYFTLKSRAKIIVLTNSPPKFNTTSSYADQRRLDLITFDRTISEDEKDVFLDEKLTSPEELSGFLNLALIGLDYLLKHGWARSMSIQEMAEKFDRFGNTVKAFVTEKCRINYKVMIPTTELYSIHYVRFCEENNRTPEAFNIFGGELAKMGIDK